MKWLNANMAVVLLLVACSTHSVDWVGHSTIDMVDLCTTQPCAATSWCNSNTGRCEPLDLNSNGGNVQCRFAGPSQRYLPDNSHYEPLVFCHAHISDQNKAKIFRLDRQDVLFELDHHQPFGSAGVSPVLSGNATLTAEWKGQPLARQRLYHIAQTPQRLHVQVTDAQTDQPVRSATVAVWCQTNEAFLPNVLTDSQGTATWIPEDVLNCNTLDISVFASGYDYTTLASIAVDTQKPQQRIDVYVWPQTAAFASYTAAVDWNAYHHHVLHGKKRAIRYALAGVSHSGRSWTQIAASNDCNTTTQPNQCYVIPSLGGKKSAVYLPSFVGLFARIPIKERLNCMTDLGWGIPWLLAGELSIAEASKCSALIKKFGQDHNVTHISNLLARLQQTLPELAVGIDHPQQWQTPLSTAQWQQQLSNTNLVAVSPNTMPLLQPTAALHQLAALKLMRLPPSLNVSIATTGVFEPDYGFVPLGLGFAHQDLRSLLGQSQQNAGQNDLAPMAVCTKPPCRDSNALHWLPANTLPLFFAHPFASLQKLSPITLVAGFSSIDMIGAVGGADIHVGVSMLLANQAPADNLFADTTWPELPQDLQFFGLNSHNALSLQPTVATGSLSLRYTVAQLSNTTKWHMLLPASSSQVVLARPPENWSDFLPDTHHLFLQAILQPTKTLASLLVWQNPLPPLLQAMRGGFVFSKIALLLESLETPVSDAGAQLLEDELEW